MALTSESLLAELGSLEVEHDVLMHRAVLTTEEQGAALAGVDGVLTKSLFLKDKKHRLYIITTLTDTKVDLKVLSARLGVGKGGVRAAPEELLESVLQVSHGPVTPLAACQPTAECVVLIMDQKIESVQRVLVHPLVSTATLSITPAGLNTLLRSHGQEPVYVDLEAAMHINKDNPPDLKELADSAQPCQAYASSKGQQTGAQDTPSKSVKPTKASESKGQQTGAHGTPSKSAKPAKAGEKKTSTQGGGQASAEADNVILMAARLLNLVNEKLGGGEPSSTSHAAALQGLKADFEMELNAFRNIAYSRGFMASRDQIKAACSGIYR